MNQGTRPRIIGKSVVYKDDGKMERYPICRSRIEETRAQTKKVSPPKRRVTKINKGNVS